MKPFCLHTTTTIPLTARTPTYLYTASTGPQAAKHGFVNDVTPPCDTPTYLQFSLTLAGMHAGRQVRVCG